MADFYTVLCNALDRVGADGPDERERVYVHVRDVMVRKLRNYRPPLSEEVIATRLETFESAIDRIEQEIADAAAAAEAAAYQEVARSEASNRSERQDWDRPDGRTHTENGNAEAAREPIWGSPAIDMAWDESSEQWREPSRRESQTVPASDWVEEPPIDRDEPPRIDPQSQDYDDELGEEDHLDDEDDFGEEDKRPKWRRTLAPKRNGADRPHGWSRRPVRADPSVPPFEGNDEIGADPEPQQRPHRRRIPAAKTSGIWSRFTGARPVRIRSRPDEMNEDEMREARQPPRHAPARRDASPQPPSRRNRRQSDDPIDQLASRLDTAGSPARAEPLLIGGPAPTLDEPVEPRFHLPSPQYLEEEQRRERIPSGRKARRPERQARGERSERRSNRRDSTAPPPQSHYDDEDNESEFDGGAPPDRYRRYVRWASLGFAVIVIGSAFFVFGPTLFPDSPEADDTADVAPDAASDVAPEIAEDGETIILFRGQDPTVFESGADNAIDFVSSDGQGYVRIGSTITSGGARMVIGPGVTSRLAGHDVRVVMEVRGAPENPAATTRLGYQNGVAINEWRILRVPAEFGVITATWTVPDSVGNVADYVLIEPGVPGDGNAIDIRAVLIEIVD